LYDENLHAMETDTLRSYSPRGAYVNFLTDEGQDRVRESYQGNYND
jgi:hypothetical protein